jgi:hypothetical protein
VTASEKLKALDGRFALPNWPKGEHIPNREYHTHGELWGETEEALVSVRNALPQIVAVVEAADTVAHRRDVNSIPALRDALAALEEALP